MSSVNDPRALLARFYVDGQFDHKAFLAEMDARAEILGMKLSKKQYGLLGQIAKTYVKERRS